MQGGYESRLCDASMKMSLLRLEVQLKVGEVELSTGHRPGVRSASGRVGCAAPTCAAFSGAIRTTPRVANECMHGFCLRKPLCSGPERAGVIAAR